MNEVSALVSCSGDVLASASADGTVRVWDTRTGMTAAEMRGHAGRVNALAVDRWAMPCNGDDEVFICCVCVTRHTSHVTRHTSHVTHHTSHVTRHVSQAFTLYSGGRDKAVHEWQGAAWTSASGDTLTFAGNLLPPPCSDVVTALAACSGGRVVAGSKNGCIQTWREGKAEGSTSIAHGCVNAVQVAVIALHVLHGTGTHTLQLLGSSHVLVGCADGCVVKVMCDV